MDNLKNIVVSALLYWVFGKLALMLAIPPGYATAIWPSAGIALALMLRYGYWIWPGVLLGSFFVNIGTSFNTESIAHSILLAAGIGIGAALQAAFGTYLVRSRLKTLDLIRISDIGQFLLFGGAIGCLVNASIGIMALVLGGKITLDVFLSSWATWWVGDVMGVFLFAPLSFVWLFGKEEIWRERRYFLTVPLLIVFVVIVSIFYFGYQAENKKTETRFEIQVNGFTRALEYELREFYVVLDALQGFYEGSEHVTRGEFRTFINHVLKRFPEIKSVAWAPKVVRAERQKFLDQARKEGFPNYYFKEVGPDGSFVPAGDRDVYFPLFYVEPVKGNEVALGIDNGSEPNRLKATMHAADLNQSIATAPIILAQDKKEQLRSILLINPIYHTNMASNTIEARRKNLKGFITATTRVADVISGAAAISFPMNQIRVTITDITTSNEIFVYETPGQIVDFKGGVKKNTVIDVQGRKWKLAFLPTVNFYSSLQSWTLWYIIVGALLLSTFLNVLLLFITGQTNIVSRVVGEKTRELTERTKELEETKSGLEGKIQDRTQELEQARAQLETEVAERTKELNIRMKELERVNQVMVGREDKMIELKRTIKQLQEKLDESSK